MKDAMTCPVCHKGKVSRAKRRGAIEQAGRVLQTRAQLTPTVQLLLLQAELEAVDAGDAFIRTAHLFKVIDRYTERHRIERL